MSEKKQTLLERDASVTLTFADWSRVVASLKFAASHTDSAYKAVLNSVMVQTEAAARVEALSDAASDV